METKNQWKAWIYLAPALILLAIFTFYPFIKTIIISFMGSYNQSGDLVGYNPTSAYGYEFTLNNFYCVRYMEVFEDGEWINQRVVTGALGSSEFFSALKNTAFIAVITVPGSTIIALLMAVALNSIKPLQKAYQTIFFLPYLTNALAMGAVFATFFKMVGTQSSTETLGLVNDMLALFGIEHINWMNVGSSRIANYFVVVVYSTWSGLPFKILILFSALQNVGKQYYDAAKIDGATKPTILTKITVPLISPMLSYLLITGIMGALKSYSSIVGLFGDSMGPMNDYEMGTMVGYIYDMIGNDQIGYAAAGSIILFIIIMIFTAINLQVSKKRVHY
jgi:multiple sugar transport system permease protein